jgi:hypothetical protein
MKESKSRVKMSPLQCKGMLTLMLLLAFESVSVSNAAKMWSMNAKSEDTNNFQKQKGFFKSSATVHEECLLTGDSSSCPSAPPTLSAGARGVLGGLSKRIPMLQKNAKDCCKECLRCDLSRCTSLPRGGHAHGAAEKIVESVSKGAAPYGIPLNGWKVIFQAILTTINVLCWLIPLKSKKISENKLGLSLANAFSGGVFLSLAFGHLIPECVHGFEGYNEVTPYLLVLSGYLLIFFVEKVAFDAHDILHEMEHAGDHKASKNGEVAEATGTTGRSALILLGALAVHSILEMTALGLADSFGDCSLLTLSIALHQVSLNLLLLKLGSCCLSIRVVQCTSTSQAKHNATLLFEHSPPNR